MPAAAIPLATSGIGAASSLIGGGKQAASQSHQQNLEQQQLQQQQNIENQDLSAISNPNGPIQQLVNFNDTNALQEAGQGDVNTIMSRLGGAAANPGQLAQSLLNQNQQGAMQTNASEKASTLQSAAGDEAQLLSGAGSIGANTAQQYGANASSYGNPWGSALTSLSSSVPGLSAGKSGAPSNSALPQPTMAGIGSVGAPSSGYLPLSSSSSNYGGGAMSPFGSVGGQSGQGQPSQYQSNGTGSNGSPNSVS